MNSINPIFEFLCDWAPLETAAEWDNVGLQVGDLNGQFDIIILAIDINSTLLNELKSKKNCVIITHHPLFFSPIKQLNFANEVGEITKTLIQNNHTLISMHTNLDVAEGGVNHCLMNAYGFDSATATPLGDDFGHIITPKSPLKFDTLFNAHPAQHKGSLNTNDVHRIGFGCGSGKSLINVLKEKRVDTFITGEIGYHDEVYCDLNDIRLIILGHKESEIFILSEIKKRLKNAFPQIKTVIHN